MPAASRILRTGRTRSCARSFSKFRMYVRHGDRSVFIMQNISTLISQARAYGHEDTFSSTRRPRTREEFASPFVALTTNSYVDGGHWQKSIEQLVYGVAPALGPYRYVGEGSPLSALPGLHTAHRTGRPWLAHTLRPRLRLLTVGPQPC